jgi:hypothetical protein
MSIDKFSRVQFIVSLPNQNLVCRVAGLGKNFEGIESESGFGVCINFYHAGAKSQIKHRVIDGGA